MSNVKVNPFSTRAARLTPLAAAVALALYGAADAATVTPLQLPGGGHVFGGGIGATSFNNTTGVGQITNGGGSTVINWGVAGGGDSNLNPISGGAIGGFNVGSSANMDFIGGGTVLNVDVSGNSSQILGTLQSSNASTNIYVANGNGIIVGAGATISAPSVYLIGAAFSDATRNAFLAGNLIFDANQGATVDVQGGNWSGTSYAFIAGGQTVNVTWTQGKQPTCCGHTDATILGGVSYNQATGQYIAATTPGKVNLTLLPNGPTPYNGTHLKVWANGDLNLQAGSNVGVLQAWNGNFQWTGTFTNNGVIAADLNGLLTHPFNPASTTPTVGYNVVSFTTAAGAPIPFGGFTNNGTLSDTGASNSFYALPGSIVNNGTFYYGNSVSQISAGNWYGENLNANFINTGSFLPLGVGQLYWLSAGRDVTNSGTLRTQANVWPFRTEIEAETGNVTNTGTLEVPSNLEVYTDKGTHGGNIVMGGTVNFFNPGFGGAYIEMYADTVGDVTWSANTTLAANTWVRYFDAEAYKGTVNINAPVNVLADTWWDAVYLDARNVNVNKPITVGIQPGGSRLGQVEIWSEGPASQVTIGSGGSITAGNVSLDGGSNTVTKYDLNGPITALGNANDGSGMVVFGGYVDHWWWGGSYPVVEGEAVAHVKGAGPASLITANQVYFYNVKGNVKSNNISATDWFNNALWLATTGMNPYVEFTLNGNGPQLFKLHIAGDATLSSGGTSTVGCSGTGCGLGGFLPQFVTPPVNRDSRLLVEATGTLMLTNGQGQQGSGVGVSGGSAFHFPGLMVFKANTIDIQTTMDNGYADKPANYGYTVAGGQWYESNSINLGAGGGLFYTTGTSWINFSSTPVGMSPVAWGVVEGFNTTLSQYYLIQAQNPDSTKLHYGRSYDAVTGLIEQ